MGQLSLSLLGRWQVTLAGEAVAGFRYDKVRALLAYLAVEAGRPHRRETLLGLLWPELPELAARNNLRQTLLTLREAIGDRTADPPYLHSSRTAIQFNSESDHWLDVASFLHLLAVCRQHHHRRPESCRPCARRLEQVAALYRGPFLADFSLPDSVEFEEWATLKREWLHLQAVEALTQLGDYHERRGNYRRAQQAARRQLELDPWREAAHRQMMRLLLLSGERSAALLQYEQCRQILAEDLGVEPEAETTALYEHLRDASDDKPLAPTKLALPAVRPHTLPPPSTAFVGREAELAAIGRRLDEPACRLLTLVGPGGVGKTRLALQAAADNLDALADGVFYVPLASLDSVERLATTIAATLGLEPGTADPRLALLHALRNKELLLLLDSFEHLLPGTALLADILHQAPEVTLLVTSRERLNLHGEWLLQVGGLPLPLPSDADVERNDAVQLFLQSARRVRPEFALAPDNRNGIVSDIVDICRLVEGLPLAIELAAAWVRALSCGEIATEIERSIGFLTSTLRDLPARHQSLTAVFDHSWRLLSAEEQAVLRALSVFQGGFRRQAAEQVAETSLAVLAALVDKSLLQWSPTGRYQMHELVRQYAHEQLQGSGEVDEIQASHFDYYLAWATMAESHLVGTEIGGWLDQFEAEKGNLRAALAWILARGDAERALRLVGVLWWFWYTRGHFNEGREWLSRALAADEVAAPTDARARALSGAGVLAWNQGDYAAARLYYEESLTIKRADGDRLAISAQLNNLGNLAMDEGDYETARRFHEESLAIKRELHDKQGIAVALGNLGLVAFKEGAYEAARRLQEESLAIKREFGDVRGISITVGNLGGVLFEQGDYAGARSLLTESLSLKRELGDKWGVAVILRNLGEVALREGNVAAARELFAQCLEIRRALGDQWSIADSLEAYAALASVESRPLDAARLWGAAEALREAIGALLPAGERKRHDQDAADVRAQLDDERFTAAWAEGRAISPAQAVALAWETCR